MTGDIVSDIRMGDKKAFRVFFEDYYPVLYSFAMKYIRDTDAGRDVAQDVLLKYWETKEEYFTLSEVRGFLYVSVRNRCFNLLKKSRVEERYIQEMLQAGAESYEEDEIENEVLLLLYKAVNALPTQMRRIITSSMAGKRNAEIAEEMGIADGTLHTLKKIAYQKLRQALKDIFILLFFFLFLLNQLFR
ncbi:MULTISPECIES: sigma-70 family RNA polymerase sigma factor [Butyricimonas]|uniref:sigma-70 family RNA polymerase sigma factor n=1 Tax=Butyricimonas TaxID=574697 RepID=UPI001D09320B|nr:MULTISPECIES: sigma-70 family RNA polymerase sigma factor [Butyricimonas]MCB6972445.1 sigma-70 family RNA polymerase sigma factor [Butyricimonas synergistica]MCG4519453.1 sigma-70 family RNA polymerase sigma factor [Butyricimonas sp. DFI.6.44]